jgi:transcriptional regulator with XRE-family HTH domain
MRIAEIMVEKNITSKRLAELTGISQRTIESYRGNKRLPNFKAGLDIAEALGVSPYDLLDDEEKGSR